MVADGGSVYMDFKKHPELIRSALEDLLPFKKWGVSNSFIF